MNHGGRKQEENATYKTPIVLPILCAHPVRTKLLPTRQNLGQVKPQPSVSNPAGFDAPSGGNGYAVPDDLWGSWQIQRHPGFFIPQRIFEKDLNRSLAVLAGVPLRCRFSRDSCAPYQGFVSGNDFRCLWSRFGLQQEVGFSRGLHCIVINNGNFSAIR